jgi:hypothetical protein
MVLKTELAGSTEDRCLVRSGSLKKPKIKKSDEKLRIAGSTGKTENLTGPIGLTTFLILKIFI